MALREAKGVMFLTGDPETEELTTPYAGGELGNFAEFDRGSGNICRYRLVKAAAGITPVAGQVLYWNNKAIYEVTTANAKRAQLAGICVQAKVGAAKYFWALVRGDRNVLFIGGVTSAPDASGKPVVGSGTDGQADCLALATAPTIPLIGATLGTVSSNLALVRVNVPDQA